ncbi:MAG: hypothetical protein BGN86_00320 [Caulobacterales bacterium 68-7]|nr:MAG: hypothetical protein BGN86_00320 [Caulobacterales bacterium 68-7]
MILKTGLPIASLLALALGLAACATPATEVADASGAKPKKAQTYNPAFQNAFDALNHPAVGFSPPGPRSPLGR